MCIQFDIFTYTSLYLNLFTAANSDSLKEVRVLIEEGKYNLVHAPSSSLGSHKEATSDASQQSTGNDKRQRCQKLLQTMSCENVSDDMRIFYRDTHTH